MPLSESRSSGKSDVSLDQTTGHGQHSERTKRVVREIARKLREKGVDTRKFRVKS